MNGPTMRKTLSITYEQALERVPEVLKAEGFGVLTEIDVKATLAQKLGVDFRRYKILGACNPPFAHQALSIDLEAGVMIPCNVIVYEDDERRTVVMAVDPVRAAAGFGNERLTALAQNVKQKLSAALAKL